MLFVSVRDLGELPRRFGAENLVNCFLKIGMAQKIPGYLQIMKNVF